MRDLNEGSRAGGQRQVRGADDGWDEAACVNFFEWVLIELRALTESGSDLARCVSGARAEFAGSTR